MSNVGHGVSRSEPAEEFEEHVFPASFNQETLLLSQELSGADAPCRAPHFPIAFRIVGGVNRSALTRALDALVRRHDILRTSFETSRHYSQWDRSMLLSLYQRTGLFVPGLFRQRVYNTGSIPLLERSVDEGVDEALPLLIEREIDEAFNDDHPHRPRALVVHAPPNDSWLILMMSHVVADGWSVQILRRELPILYAASLNGDISAPVNPAPTYGEFVTSQHLSIASGQMDSAGRYWAHHWSHIGDQSIRRMDLPFARQDLHPSRIVKYAITITPADSSGLLEIARRFRTTPYSVVRTALTIVFHAYTGKTRIPLWANFSNRDAANEHVLGHCSNTHVLAVDVDRTESCLLLERRTSRAVLDGQRHQALPFPALGRYIGRNPAVQCDCRINFDLLREPRVPRPSALQSASVTGGRRWMDLDIRLRQEPNGFGLQATFNSGRYESGGVAEMLANVGRVLSRWTADHYASIASCASCVR